MVDDTPLVEGALAQLAGRIVRSYWGGDHSLFLAQVDHARYGEGTPLLFHGGRYERLVTDPKVLSALPPELLAQVRRERRGARVRRRRRRSCGVASPGDAVLVVLEGSVRVTRPGKEIVLGPGEIVGELEVLSPTAGRPHRRHRGGRRRARPRRSRATDLRAALVAHPDAALALLEVLADRFREQRLTACLLREIRRADFPPQ